MEAALDRIGLLELMIMLAILAFMLTLAFLFGYFVGHARGRTVGAREAERMIKGLGGTDKNQYRG